MAGDARVGHLVGVLLRSQWPDGGWNCDLEPRERRSSFHETLAPIWGLVEYHRATGDRDSFEGARRAAELLLEHHLFRSRRSGKVIDAEWLNIHWPHYWHYDFLQGLRAVRLAGMLRDPRADEALELLRSLRRPDRTWKASGRKYWSQGKSRTEVVDWGDAHQIVTAAALLVLR
jgi:hypothetical protein